MSPLDEFVLARYGHAPSGPAAPEGVRGADGPPSPTARWGPTGWYEPLPPDPNAGMPPAAEGDIRWA